MHSKLVRQVRKVHAGFTSIFRLFYELKCLLTLRGLISKHGKKENKFKNVLIDGHFNNLGYWYRLQLFRAALGLNNATETGYIWKWQKFSCLFILRIFGVQKIVCLHRKPSAASKSKAKRLLHETKTQSDFFNLELPFGIPPSILYDEILKRQRVPFVNLKDPECIEIISEFFEAIATANNTLDQLKPDLVILSHTIGTQCAPIAWIAASKGITVLNLWGKYGLIRATKIKNPSDIFSSQDRPYYKDFSKLSSEQVEDFANIGKKYLRERFNGRTDDLGSKFAFSKVKNKNSIKIEKKKPVIAVYASNWFDYPHSFGMTNFFDFHDWLNETKKVAETKTDCIWLFKAHPVDKWYGGPGLKDLFQNKRDHIHVLDENVSSDDVIAISDALITFHGSAGIEFASEGKPVLLADNGWYHDWGFCLISSSREDYLFKLNSDWFMKKVSAEKRKKALIFAGAYYCCPFWQSGLVLKDDSDRERLRSQIPKLISGYPNEIEEEVDSILGWVFDEQKGYHSRKMLQTRGVKLSNISID